MATAETYMQEQINNADVFPDSYSQGRENTLDLRHAWILFVGYNHYSLLQKFEIEGDAFDIAPTQRRNIQNMLLSVNQ